MSSLIRFRSVCKSWYNMVDDPNFQDACSRVPARAPCLVFKNEEGCSIYEPCTDNWMPIPASFFQPKNEHQFQVVGSKGGRLLLQRHYRLMLFNPLNQYKKNLPPMLDLDQGVHDIPVLSDVHIMGLYIDDSAGVLSILVLYKKTNVVVADEEDDIDDEGLEPFLAQIYDSRSNSWDMKGTFNPEYELSIENASLLDSTLHCLVMATKAHARHNKLAIYSVLKDTWDEESIYMPEEDAELVAPHLFTHGCKQLLVAALPRKECPHEGSDFPQWRNIIIWELKMIQPMGPNQWVRMFEIERGEVQRELWDVHMEDFIFLPENDFLYFGSKTGSTLGMINLKSQTALAAYFPRIYSLRWSRSQRFERCEFPLRT